MSIIKTGQPGFAVHPGISRLGCGRVLGIQSRRGNDDEMGIITGIIVF